MTAPTPPTTPSPGEVARLAHAVLEEVGTAVVGMQDALRVAMAAILSGGHVLFEDVPGSARRSRRAASRRRSGCEFRRLQCTPDLLPERHHGVGRCGTRSRRRSRFRPGPVFTGLLLADEINRTAPKTQSALLEAMAERQVTVDGHDATRWRGPST